jgi:hypothetical protein
MLFQDAPPDTSGYMIAGYVIFFVISVVYVLSLALRRRNLEQDLQTLERLEAQGRPSRRPAPTRGRKTGKKAIRK